MKIKKHPRKKPPIKLEPLNFLSSEVSMSSVLMADIGKKQVAKNEPK